MSCVLLFGVSWSVFLSHPTRPTVSRNQPLCCSPRVFDFGGQYITIAVMSSCQLRSLMAHALACNFEGSSNVLITYLGFQDRLIAKNGHSCKHVREARVFTLPSHLEMSSMLSNSGLVREAIPESLKKRKTRPTLRALHTLQATTFVHTQKNTKCSSPRGKACRVLGLLSRGHAQQNGKIASFRSATWRTQLEPKWLGARKHRFAVARCCFFFF